MDEVEIEIEDEGEVSEKAVAVIRQHQPENLSEVEPLIGFLGVADPQDRQNRTMLKEIWSHLKDRPKTSEKLVALRDMESRLGMPKLGESRLSKLYSYIKAQEAVDEAEKIRNQYLR